MASNGYLDTSNLTPLINFVPIENGAGGLATAEVARQWRVMATDFKTALGYSLDASEGYRDYARQVHERLIKGTGAAIPGTSNHGLALAIDAGSGVGYADTSASKWVTGNCRRYGFIQDVGGELWHLHYIGGATITNNPINAKPVEVEESVYVFVQDAKSKGIWLVSLVNGKKLAITSSSDYKLLRRLKANDGNDPMLQSELALLESKYLSKLK
jgi:hypothetical protein